MNKGERVRRLRWGYEGESPIEERWKDRVELDADRESEHRRLQKEWRRGLWIVGVDGVVMAGFDAGWVRCWQ